MVSIIPFGFVPTGMNGRPQNVLLNFRFEFPKSDLSIYHPSGISEIFCQMVSTPCKLLSLRKSLVQGTNQTKMAEGRSVGNL